jgi:transposase
MLSAGMANNLILRGLKLIKQSFSTKKNEIRLWVEKKSTNEVCPKCAMVSSSVYDHREVNVVDEPIRDNAVILKIRKRRFYCKPCRRPFTEPISGIKKSARVTERYRDYVYICSERFTNLSTVRKVARCSFGFVYKTYYERLKRYRIRENRAWPTTLGIDEHFFKRNKVFGHREFVTMLVDYNRHRLLEVVEGRQGGLLRASLSHLEGRERVKNVAMDLSETYRSFAREFFPNAKIIADKFHVVRLFNPMINKHRKEILGDKRALPVRRLLLTNGNNLEPDKRLLLHKWLRQHDKLREVYFYKEALHRLYRTHGVEKARTALINMTDAMARSTLPEILSLRKTLLKWKNEILAYFETKITNAKTEGYNNKAKVIKRRSYGFRSFKNYRLRLLADCS